MRLTVVQVSALDLLVRERGMARLDRRTGSALERLGLASRVYFSKRLYVISDRGREVWRGRE